MPYDARCRREVNLRAVLLITTVVVSTGLASVEPAFGGEACHTSSDYDVTLDDSALQFARKTGPAQSIEMRQGALAINRKPITLGADDKKRVIAFEARVRELVPRIKTIGQRGVDLMVAAIREEAAKASPQSAASPELNARVDARAEELKRRIAASRSSKEWHPDAIAGYMTGVVADVAPLIAGDLSQKAVDLTMKGDLSGVMALTDKALQLRASLEQRIRTRLETLQPQIDRLCPSLRELDRLESSIGAARIDLIKVES
jgi:hypothetical protein